MKYAALGEYNVFFSCGHIKKPGTRYKKQKYFYQQMQCSAHQNIINIHMHESHTCIYRYALEQIKELNTFYLYVYKQFLVLEITLDHNP